jgi:hypothetical protein
VTIFSQHGRDGHGVCDGNFSSGFCHFAKGGGNGQHHSAFNGMFRGEKQCLPIEYP